MTHWSGRTVTLKYIAGLAALVITAPAVAEPIRLCAISVIDGPSVQVLRAGQDRGAKVGYRIFNADRIITGPETRITIACDDGMRTIIAGGTEIDLGTLTGAAKTEGHAARLLRGLAGFILPLVGARRFEVRTPSAVASVRSTEWLVNVTDGATAVFVRDGAVDVFTARGGALLEPGEGIDVTAAGEAGPVKTWGEGRKVKLRKRLGPTWE